MPPYDDCLNEVVSFYRDDFNPTETNYMAETVRYLFL